MPSALKTSTHPAKDEGSVDGEGSQLSSSQVRIPLFTKNFPISP